MVAAKLQRTNRLKVTLTVATRLPLRYTTRDMGLPKPLVTRSDEILSGAVVFAGTRVPVQTLLDYLEEGDTLDSFLEDFPTVSREHAVAVLELAKESVFAHADSSG